MVRKGKARTVDSASANLPARNATGHWNLQAKLLTWVSLHRAIIFNLDSATIDQIFEIGDSET